MSTQRGYLVIMDISGYTEYLTRNALEHAQGVLAEITDLLISELSGPFRFVELEGDAVFVFAPEAAVEDGERLVDIIEATYAAFRLLQQQMLANTSCTCAACRAIKDLDLKCVAHFGEFAPQRSPRGIKLVGKDVILVHRLLKNSVIEETGVLAYGLYTLAFVSKVVSETFERQAHRHSETLSEFGAVEGRVFDLRKALERLTGARRFFVESTEADFELITDLPASRRTLWAYHVDASRRLKWQTDTVGIKNSPAADGRTGIGMESYCDHGSYRLNHRFVDWHPFEYVTMDTIAVGKRLIKPPSGLATFFFQEISADQTRVSMRIRLHNRTLLSRLSVRLLNPVVKRQWRAHYAELSRLVAADKARIDSALGATALIHDVA